MKTYRIEIPVGMFSVSGPVEIAADDFSVGGDGSLWLYADTKAVAVYSDGRWLSIQLVANADEPPVDPIVRTARIEFFDADGNLVGARTSSSPNQAWSVLIADAEGV